MTTKSKIVLTAIISAVVTAIVSVNATVFINDRFGAFLPSGEGDEALSKKINSIEYFLDSRYLYDYDREKVSEGAIKGMVNALDEPYTQYFTRDEFNSYMDVIKDEYMGIGIVISVTGDNKIIVISTFEDSPAYKAGILPADIISEIDGKKYDGYMLNDAVAYIKGGEINTPVKLKLIRGDEEVEVEAIRSNIINKSVDYEMLDNSIGLVHISGFNTSADGSDRNTFTEFSDAVAELKESGMQKMIIDLRDNPGGELEVVCNIADMLLPKGVITYTEDKQKQRQEYYSDDEALGIPIVVLTNGNSASASEVLTGALKDYGVATIVGTKTFGKGIVQALFPFYDGSGMSITIANYYSPKGVCIHGVGIEPDIVVEMDEEYSKFYASSVPHELDNQLKKAIEILNEE